VTQTVPARTLTVKGERTRGKIVDTAATLMLNDGLAGTTIAVRGVKLSLDAPAPASPA
jgi:AcrR family transcriptional regulator